MTMGVNWYQHLIQAKGSGMLHKVGIEDLIEWGWNILEDEFGGTSVQKWRDQAFDRLTALLGRDHRYTRFFYSYMRQGDKFCLSC